MFRAKIIDSRKYKQTRYVRPILVAVLIAFFWLFYFNIPGISDILELDITPYFYIVGVIAVVLYGLVFLYSRLSRTLGRIEITPVGVSVAQNNEVVNFDISTLKNIRISQNSFVGMDYMGGSFLDNNFSGNNYIEFDCNETHYRYEFKIDTSYSATQLDKVFDVWRENKIDYSYTMQ